MLAKLDCISRLRFLLINDGKWKGRLFSSIACFSYYECTRMVPVFHNSFNNSVTNIIWNRVVISIYSALRDLVPCAQVKKREKHPWRSVTLLKVTLLHGHFSRFLNCTNGTKSHKASHIPVFQGLEKKVFKPRTVTWSFEIMSWAVYQRDCFS